MTISILIYNEAFFPTYFIIFNLLFKLPKHLQIQIKTYNSDSFIQVDKRLVAHVVICQVLICLLLIMTKHLSLVSMWHHGRVYLFRPFSVFFVMFFMSIFSCPCHFFWYFIFFVCHVFEGQRRRRLCGTLSWRVVVLGTSHWLFKLCYLFE
jgi:hypothetical protein